MGVGIDMTNAANELLSALSPTQHEAATWTFADVERRLWFYTPTDHGGLPLAEMDAAQQRLVWRLLASGLSEAGYNTTALIVGQENILDRVEGFGVDYGRTRGRDPLLYWVAVFGTPADTGRWGWRFGGHHVSLNFTIDHGEVVAATPCFLGADPAGVPLLGPHLHRPLGVAEDLGRELVHSLDEMQRSSALVSSSPPADLIGANRTTLSEGDHALGLPFVWRSRFEKAIDDLLGTMQTSMEVSLGGSPEEIANLAFSRRPKGLAGGDLGAEQQEILHALLLSYIGRISDDVADVQLAKVMASGLDGLHFLWAGGMSVGDPHYYRIQGAQLLVEYDNAARGGNHVHTVWRDLDHDFGGDPLAQHYAGHATHH